MRLISLVASLLMVLHPFAVCQESQDILPSSLKQDSIDPVSEAIMAQSSAPSSTGHELLEFTCNLYKTVTKHLQGKNLLLSPLSISLALGMTLAGSVGQSSKQLIKALGFKSDDDKNPHEMFKSFLESLQQSDKDDKNNTSLYLANFVYPDKRFSVLASFYDLLKKYYNTTTEMLDYANKPEEAASLINGQISEATHGKIKDMVKSEDMKADTRLILVNAVYFKSFWATKFNPELTRLEEFYLSENEAVSISMMYRESKYRMAMSEELQCRALELPYVDDNLSMIILLPHGIDGLTTIEENLNASNLRAMISDFGDKIKARVWLPKFKMDEYVSLEPVLKDMQITDIFDPNVADLSGISEEPGLYVSAVEHKAVIEVNEEGTEAAATTVVRISKRCLEIVEEFRVDRPFMFVLLHKQQNVVLFVGSYKKPASESEGKAVHEEL